MKVVAFSQFGNPEVLQWIEVGDPPPAPGEVLVRLVAAGMNFADVYRRQGRFTPAGSPPWIPGFEGAGTVTAAGEEAVQAGFPVGTRVGWCDSPNSNAELVCIPIEKLIRLPNHISEETAAAVLLQGMTAHYLCKDSHPIMPGEWAVVHAAGGGVGLLLLQMIKALGGRVIALASSKDKQVAATAAGADIALGYECWVEKVWEITGNGADVAFDSVGTTITESLAAVRRRGRAVFFGIAGGRPPAIDPLSLMQRSLTLTGGDLWSMIDGPDARRNRAADIFSWISDGSLRVSIAARFPLSNTREAHRLIESRRAVGKILLVA